jgi:hypothetical protein
MPQELKTIYREKYYICGEYLDTYIFPVYKRPGKRGKKAQPTTETQKKLNTRHATEKLTRLHHANFTPDDLELGLSYRDNPESDEEALRLVQNFLRRIRRLRKKLGLPALKYICVTEKSKSGRYHHHVTINGGLDRDVIESLWGLGYANSRRLQFSENGLTALSHYIVKEPIGGKRWNASKNLIDPEPRENDYRIRSRRRAEALAKDKEDREPWEKLYPDYFLSEVTPFHNDENGGIYIFARLYRKDGTFIKPTRKRRN